MSEPQMAARVTRMMASLGCSIRGIGLFSTRTRYGPRYVIARMKNPPVCRLHPVQGEGRDARRARLVFVWVFAVWRGRCYCSPRGETIVAAAARCGGVCAAGGGD